MWVEEGPASRRPTGQRGCLGRCTEKGSEVSPGAGDRGQLGSVWGASGVGGRCAGQRDRAAAALRSRGLAGGEGVSGPPA